VRGRAPLAIGAFDAADEAGTAERDLRFPIISAPLRVIFENFWTARDYNPGSGNSASMSRRDQRPYGAGNRYDRGRLP